MSEVRVGKTYIGALDCKRGFGTHRTVLQMDAECDLVVLRMEVGADPPACYVSDGTMPLTDFAKWAQKAKVEATAAPGGEKP